MELNFLYRKIRFHLEKQIAQLIFKLCNENFKHRKIDTNIKNSLYTCISDSTIINILLQNYFWFFNGLKQWFPNFKKIFSGRMLFFVFLKQGALLWHPTWEGRESECGPGWSGGGTHSSVFGPLLSPRAGAARHSPLGRMCPQELLTAALIGWHLKMNSDDIFLLLRNMYASYKTWKTGKEDRLSLKDNYINSVYFFPVILDSVLRFVVFF